MDFTKLSEKFQVKFHTFNVFLLTDISSVPGPFDMSRNTIIVALALLLLASVATFVGVFFGVGSRKLPSSHVYSRAAVAADAGPCSEVGR